MTDSRQMQPSTDRSAQAEQGLLRLHLVPNSHIDPVWLWDKYEGIDEVLNTFASACDRLDEYPQLTFSASSMQFYEWAMQFDRPLFERIKKYVRAGRWEVTGGWWVEGDTNLPSESSLLKQAEIGQAFAQEHFGFPIEVAYLVDTFGHPATLPKILAQTGFRYFIFCRPSMEEKPDLPGNLFYWAYEDHRILSYRLKHHYVQYAIAAPEKLDPVLLLPKLEDPEYQSNSVNCYLFGVGDHGGGPAIAEIEFYNDYIRRCTDGDVDYSTCQRFFEAAARRTNIPTYSGDLHMHAVGCYSVLRDVKVGVRGCEQALQTTARAMELADRSTDELEPLWKRTLFNEFHDILPGSCSPGAAGLVRADLGGVLNSCRDLTYAAFKSLTRRRPVRHREGELRVFNALPFEVKVPLSLELFSHFKSGSAFRDESNEQLTFQEIPASVRCVNRRFEFVDTLPSGDFKSYWFDHETPIDPPDDLAAHFQEGVTIAKGQSRIDPDGSILISTSTGQIPLRVGPIQFLMLEDDSDTWGHGVYRYDQVQKGFESQSNSMIDGPVTAKLYQRWNCGRSSIDVIYSIYEGLSQVLLDITVYWAEHRKILKMQVDPDVAALDHLLMQAAGGPIRRSVDGLELPMHHWVYLPADPAGLLLVQEGAFACDCKGGRLRLTLVRSSLYGYDRGTTLHAPDPQVHTDQGVHRFRLWLVAQDRSDPLQFDRQAAALCEPYLVIRDGCS